MHGDGIDFFPMQNILRYIMRVLYMKVCLELYGLNMGFRLNKSSSYTLDVIIILREAVNCKCQRLSE